MDCCIHFGLALDRVVEKVTRNVPLRSHRTCFNLQLDHAVASHAQLLAAFFVASELRPLSPIDSYF